MMNDPLTLIHSDALTGLAQLDDESVQTCVTSPPYWGLRSYGTEPLVWDNRNGCKHEWANPQVGRVTGGGDRPPGNKWKGVERTGDKAEPRYFCKCGAWRGELGLEPTPELYVSHLAQIFREVKRVLRNDGTLWLNLGDSYAGGGFCGSEKALAGKQGTNGGSHNMIGKSLNHGCKPKDLVGIPWMVAFALRADGWYLRSDIIWSKPNPMPESVTDRPTKAHEYIFLLSKSQKYFYDAEAIKEPVADSSILRINQPTFDTQTGGEKDYGNGTNPNRSARKALENFAKGRTGQNAFRGQGQTRPEGNGQANRDGREMKNIGAGTMRNKRSVWEITTIPFPDAHFATFPPDLIKPCILAGAPSSGVVLDPFAGSGTTGKVAIELGRKAVLIEPKAEYVEMIKRRCQTTIGLPL